MLNPEDRRAIEGLFERLEEVENRGGERDREAEALIGQKIAAQPGAPYYMAQTVLVQEHALKVAEQRIAELEQQVAERPSGGLLGGLFGGGGGQRQRQDYRQPTRGDGQTTPARGPWGRTDSYGQPPTQPYGQPYGGGGFGGGGFLAGAAQTAMGVAGGVLLGNAIGSMFGGGDAHAAEVQPVDEGADAGQDAGGDDAGQDVGDAGGDFGGDGFDVGGDF